MRRLSEIGCWRGGSPAYVEFGAGLRWRWRVAWIASPAERQLLTRGKREKVGEGERTTIDPVRPPRPPPRLAADFQVKIFVLSLWFCGGPKYQNIVKVSKYEIVVKVSKYWLCRSRFLAPRRNFAEIRRIPRKFRQHLVKI